MSKGKGLTLVDKILVSAVDITGGGDLTKTFTAEALLLSAWESDKQAFGLRENEEVHPDSEKIYITIDARRLVQEGFLEQVEGGKRIYRLTLKSLNHVRSLKPEDATLQIKLHRTLHEEIKRILSHQTFLEWQKDQSRPRVFRDAGLFWGIAPGTPSDAVRQRMQKLEETLKTALDELERRGANEIIERQGRVLFDRRDVEKCIEFHSILKRRFEKELKLFGYLS